MPRFPPIPPAQQTPAQVTAHQQIEAYVQELYGPSALILKNEEGAFIGPFAPMLYSPALVPAYLQIARATITNPLFTPREREMAILGCLSYSRAAYGLYAHIRLALSLDFSESQVRDAAERRVPEGASDRERMFYVLGLELARTSGPLDKAIFENAEEVLGKETVAAVLHLVGGYLYSAVLFNGADVGLPVGQSLFPEEV